MFLVIRDQFEEGLVFFFLTGFSFMEIFIGSLGIFIESLAEPGAFIDIFLPK